MPCPLFLPALPLGDFGNSDFGNEGVPLGDMYGGQCAADTNAPIPIDTLRRCCNFGYARNICEHAARTDADASRFLVKSDCDGVVEVAWATERNHHPVAVGTLRIEPVSPSNEGPIDRQTRAYAASYLRRMARV